MEEGEIKDLVKVWHQKADGERDKTLKFIFVWLCFNAWLAYRSSEESDRDMLECLKRKGTAVSDIVSQYDRAFESGWFRERIQELKELSPIEDSRGKKSAVIIDDITKFDQICEAIYRIRCNLFHGGQRANKTRDIQLVTAAGYILGKWVGNLVNTW
jgi:hypothetical protein